MYVHLEQSKVSLSIIWNHRPCGLFVFVQGMDPIQSVVLIFVQVHLLLLPYLFLSHDGA